MITVNLKLGCKLPPAVNVKLLREVLEHAIATQGGKLEKFGMELPELRGVIKGDVHLGVDTAS